jgi:aryl-alcohol dehydrogenase-like predicted oxidoreductase
MERLNVPHLWGILLHSEEQLDLWNASLGSALRNAKRAKLVSRIGISVYSPERALQALQIQDLDLIQVPANVFDRRMERAGVFDLARKLEKAVFVRSIYLQGLALMRPGLAMEGIFRAKEAVAAFRQFCAEHQLNHQHFAVNYVRRMAPGARYIIGVETIAQTVENCALFQREPPSRSMCQAWTEWWPEDVDALIDPRKWPASTRK